MKLIFKLMLFALVMVGVSPFMIPGPDGKPLFSLDKLKLGNPLSSASTSASKAVKEIKSTVSKASPLETDDNTTSVHKWIDEHGVWHFSDQRNPEGKDEIVRINTNTNVVRATPVAREVPEEEGENGKRGSSKTDKKDEGPDIPFPTTVPMKDIPKLINDTRALQETMNKRYEEQQKLLESLQQ